jgi:protein SCO1/2
MYSISLDPRKDTPAVLKEYTEAYGVKRGWSFLTGKPAEIDLLRRKLGIYDPDPVIDADKTQHAALLTFGNERIGAWGAMPVLLKPARIVESVLRVMATR